MKITSSFIQNLKKIFKSIDIFRIIYIENLWEGRQMNNFTLNKAKTTPESVSGAVHLLIQPRYGCACVSLFMNSVISFPTLVSSSRNSFAVIRKIPE